MADLIHGHVTQPNGTVKIVNLETATCSCGNYQENGIPCGHALTCIMSLRLVYYPILTTLNTSANTQCSSRFKIICHIFYRLPPGKKPTRLIFYQWIYQTWNLYRHNPLRPQFRKLFPLQIMLNLHLLAHPEDVRARKDYEQVRYDNGSFQATLSVLPFQLVPVLTVQPAGELATTLLPAANPTLRTPSPYYSIQRNSLMFAKRALSCILSIFYTYFLVF